MSEIELFYEVRSREPARHLLHVTLVVRGSLPEPLRLEMPAWTPGSYLIREHARNVERLEASSPSGPCGVRKLSKDTWLIAHGNAGEVRVDYTIYANELSVRTNHVDDDHMFWNGASTYLRPIGADGRHLATQKLMLSVVPSKPEFRIATVLRSVERSPDLPQDFGRDGASLFAPASVDELMDSPVDVGEHLTLDLQISGKTISVAVWGARDRVDTERLGRHLRAIIEVESELFGGLPFERYLFLLMLSPGSRGGLEHDNCASLLASPDSFETADAYEDLLSLLAHEFLHLWHVRRVRPEGLFDYDYRTENYTRQLWLFEGGASYYDWHFLRRARIVEPRGYLRHLAGEIARLEDTPGRFTQSLEESSLDAWVKLYRPDEHTANRSVSYYLKGEIVCALLDIEIRARSGNKRSLDDVLRYLWNEYGKKNRPVPESGIEPIIAIAAEVDVADLVHAMVRTTQPLPYDRVFASAGLSLRTRPGRGTALGVRLRIDHGKTIIGTVLRGGAADRGGLSPGDEILAIDGRRIDEAGLRERLRHRRPGETVDLIVTHLDRVHTRRVTLGQPPPDGYEIVAMPDPPEEARVVGEAWLGPSASVVWNSR